MSKDKSIYVTKPFLPPLEEFTKGLEKIWSSNILTNRGPYHEEFETKLKEYLNVPHISLFSNATLALYTSLKVLGLEKCDIITTPFTFPATAHVIKLVNSNPIFVDIDPRTCCIDTYKIEDSITKKTKAILPVHVYGNYCDSYNIFKIAEKHNLKVIYDAAHCFAPNNNILKYRDLSVLSFHATKVFNTFEGGVIISQTQEMKHKIDRFCNFGIEFEDNIPDIGFNAKMNELQALIGVINLKHIDELIFLRSKVKERYDKYLRNKVVLIPSQNNSYYPILVNDRQELYDILLENGIHARKYFYPLISNLKSYPNKTDLPIANEISEKILCLPLYPDLSEKDQDKVIQIVLENIN